MKLFLEYQLISGQLGNCSQPAEILLIRVGHPCQEAIDIQVSSSLYQDISRDKSNRDSTLWSRSNLLRKLQIFRSDSTVS
jgi:hypothetical protein